VSAESAFLLEPGEVQDGFPCRLTTLGQTIAQQLLVLDEFLRSVEKSDRQSVIDVALAHLFRRESGLRVIPAGCEQQGSAEGKNGSHGML
jgi:hypothetical protein